MSQEDREIIAYAHVRVCAKKFINGQVELEQLREAMRLYDEVIAGRPVTPEAA